MVWPSPGWNLQPDIWVTLMGCGFPTMLTCVKEFGPSFPEGQRQAGGVRGVPSSLPCGLEPLTMESVWPWAPGAGSTGFRPGPFLVFCHKASSSGPGSPLDAVRTVPGPQRSQGLPAVWTRPSQPEGT